MEDDFFKKALIKFIELKMTMSEKITLDGING